VVKTEKAQAHYCLFTVGATYNQSIKCRQEPGSYSFHGLGVGDHKNPKALDCRWAENDQDLECDGVRHIHDAKWQGVVTIKSDQN